MRATRVVLASARGEYVGADWLSMLEDVGGRLVPAARNFVNSERPPPPAAGPDGVRWLAARVEDFVDRDTDDAQDDRFAEGAGALLGLLLIEHHGGRTREHNGCHRIQLGRFGWFDPFVAIQDALDADDPRSCLADYLASAEREAAQRGPVSRVVGAFAETLHRERPDLEIESQFELTVELSNGANVDLARLERVANEGNHDATLDAARRIVSMLPGAVEQSSTPWTEAAPRLLPRLVSSSFLASLPNDQSLYADDIGNDVHVALQLRYGPRARYVRAAEVADWCLEPGAARARALENLVERSKSLRLEPVADGVLRVRQGDGLDGTRLLLPDLRMRLERVAGARWAAASPHRDVLLLAYGGAIPALQRRAEDAAQRAPHAVSPALFAITADGPRPLRW